MASIMLPSGADEILPTGTAVSSSAEEGPSRLCKLNKG